MKRISLLSLAASIVFFGGCATKDVVFTQTPLCQAPIAEVSLQNITQKSSHTSISKDEYKNILAQILEGTNCLTIVPKNQDNTYALSATYEVDLDTQEKKEALSSQSTHTLKAKVTLYITGKDEIRQEVGQSMLQAQEKRVLGLGEKEEISREDESNALRNSTLIAIKNFISSIQNQVSESVTQSTADNQPQTQNSEASEAK